MEQVTILGAGISGLSASFHIGHERCQIYEAKPHYGGHIFSFTRDGFTWDDGPHVLFTDSEYVKQVFAEGVGGEFEERAPEVTNYYQGHWIDHRRNRTFTRFLSRCGPSAWRAFWRPAPES